MGANSGLKPPPVETMLESVSGRTGFGKPTRARYTVLVLSFLMAFMMYMERGAIGVAAPSIMKDFHVDKIRMGWSVFGLQLVLCSVSGSRGMKWRTSFGPRVVLAAAMAWWSVFTAATGLTWSANTLAATPVPVRDGRSLRIPGRLACLGALAACRPARFRAGFSTLSAPVSARLWRLFWWFI